VIRTCLQFREQKTAGKHHHVSNASVVGENGGCDTSFQVISFRVPGSLVRDSEIVKSLCWVNVLNLSREVLQFNLGGGFLVNSYLEDLRTLGD